MKNFLYLFTFSIVFFCVSTSCNKKKGCTDDKALNKNYEASVNDGSCRYSNVTFYASAGFYSGIPITKIDVTVGGNAIGSIPGTYYPSGPGNCSAQGTISFQFDNSNKIDWNTTVYLASGATIFGSGQVSPSSVSDCIKVNVTK